MKKSEIKKGVIIQAKCGRTLRRIVAIEKDDVWVQMMGDGGKAYVLPMSSIIEHWKVAR